jgi:hypothetical protein
VSVKLYGLMAQFDSPAAVLHAAEKVSAAGYHRWDVFSPFPIHGLDKIMGYRNSHVGLFSLAMGGGAFASVVGLIWYANTFDYPLIVGGKPMFSAPMTFVPAYIMLIMGAAIGALVVMLALNQLPRLHHPLLAMKRFDLVTRDKFVIVIGANDEKFQAEETRRLLAALGGANIETVEDPE